MSQLGKFSGEPFWVAMLWDRVLSGFSDKSVYDGSLAIDGFQLTPEIAELTGYSADPGRFVVLWESDDGFVNHTTLTSQELDDCEGFSVEEPTGDWMPGVDPDFDEIGGEAGY